MSIAAGHNCGLNVQPSGAGLRAGGRGFRAAPAALAGMFLAAAVPAWGQFNIASGSRTSVRGSSQLGQTLRSTVFRSGFSGGGFEGMFSQETSGSQFGSSIANMSAPVMSFQSARASGVSRFVGGTSPLAPTGAAPLLRYFGRSPDASWFAMRTMTGREGMPTFPRGATYEDQRTTRAIWEARTQSMMLAYHRPIYSGDYAGGARDEMTRHELANPPPLPEDIGSLEQQPQTYVSRLTARAEASRKESLGQGWAALKRGDLLRAKGHFENALIVDRRDPEPLVGKLLCAVAGREYSTAEIYIARLAVDPQVLFAQDRRLNDTYRDSHVVEGVLADVSTIAANNPDLAAMAGLRVFLLWLDNQQLAAQSAADAAAERFRGTPYATFAETMRKLSASRKAGEPPAATGT